MRSVLLCLLCLSVLPAADPDEHPLARLREPGTFALMRHALAPGAGDPDHFDLADCSTQRNLSAAGRQQARAIGDKFREAGIENARVFTSQWCRCKETAERLRLGEPVELPALNSFFQRPGRRDPRVRALKAWLKDNLEDGPVVLVTHQVVVTALTDVFPASGEIVVARRDDQGGFDVLDRVRTDE